MTALADVRRRNWIAIVVATVLMMASSLSYAAAFVGDGSGDGATMALAAIALAIAPFVFVAVAFLSRHPMAPVRVIRAMLALVVVGLAVGMLAPVLGAATGYAVGGAICLRPLPIERPHRWRITSVVFTFFYCLILLVAITPAGVLASGLVPLVMLGFADEYAIWSEQRAAG